MTASGVPDFLLELVVRLRRRGLPIGFDDCLALRSALSAGIGVGSSTEFEALCVGLWAKSLSEQETIRAVLAGVSLPAWDASEPQETPREQPARPAEIPDGVAAPAPHDDVPGQPTPPSEVPAVHRLSGMSLMPPTTGQFDSSLALAPHYPVTAREIAQTWRRLRRPIRYGTATEVDVERTVDRYARTGVFQGPVLVPPRRNTARLLLLIDRDGSMTPYRDFVEHLVREIRGAGRLESIATWYFRNLPTSRVDTGVLRELRDAFSPSLDPVLSRIEPLTAGRLYADPGLTEQRPFSSVLKELASGTAAAIISDAGAARGSLQTGRLVGTIAMVKALRAAHCSVAWINPVPASRWPGTTAEQIARHVPMSPLTAEGLHQAVDALRGRPPRTERPV